MPGQSLVAQVGQPMMLSEPQCQQLAAQVGQPQLLSQSPYGHMNAHVARAYTPVEGGYSMSQQNQQNLTPS